MTTRTLLESDEYKYFEVSDRGRSFEVSIDHGGDVRVAISDDRENYFYITPTEAKMLVEFLNRNGF